MLSVTITWHTQHDGRVCKICKALDGYVFGPYTEVPDSLNHPLYGEVWNTVLGSLAHDHGGFGSKYRAIMSNCRCRIEPKFDLKDLVEKIRELRDEVREATNAEVEPNDTISGNYRSTRSEDIGIDLSKYGIE